MVVAVGRKMVVGMVLEVGGVVGAWALAGDVNPPAGPVGPTMRTLDEVYAVAAGGGGGGGGSNAPCVAGLHGTLGVFGVCSIPGLQTQTPNPEFEVISFEQKASKPAPLGGGGGGGGVAPAVTGEFVLTKALDGTSVGLYRAVTLGTAFAAATVTLRDAGSSALQTITLKNCYVTSRKATMVYRCDGSTVMGEEIAISSSQVRYMDAVTGQSWDFNFATGAGSAN